MCLRMICMWFKHTVYYTQWLRMPRCRCFCTTVLMCLGIRCMCCFKSPTYVVEVATHVLFRNPAYVVEDEMHV